MSLSLILNLCQSQPAGGSREAGLVDAVKMYWYRRGDIGHLFGFHASLGRSKMYETKKRCAPSVFACYFCSFCSFCSFSLLSSVIQHTYVHIFIFFHFVVPSRPIVALFRALLHIFMLHLFPGVSHFRGCQVESPIGCAGVVAGDKSRPSQAKLLRWKRQRRGGRGKWRTHKIEKSKSKQKRNISTGYTHHTHTLDEQSTQQGQYCCCLDTRTSTIQKNSPLQLTPEASDAAHTLSHLGSRDGRSVRCDAYHRRAAEQKEDVKHTTQERRRGRPRSGLEHGCPALV